MICITNVLFKLQTLFAIVANSTVRIILYLKKLDKGKDAWRWIHQVYSIFSSTRWYFLIRRTTAHFIDMFSTSPRVLRDINNSDEFVWSRSEQSTQVNSNSCLEESDKLNWWHGLVNKVMRDSERIYWKVVNCYNVTRLSSVCL